MFVVVVVVVDDVEPNRPQHQTIAMIVKKRGNETGEFYAEMSNRLSNKGPGWKRFNSKLTNFFRELCEFHKACQILIRKHI